MPHAVRSGGTDQHPQLRPVLFFFHSLPPFLAPHPRQRCPLERSAGRPAVPAAAGVRPGPPAGGGERQPRRAVPVEREAPPQAALESVLPSTPPGSAGCWCLKSRNGLSVTSVFCDVPPLRCCTVHCASQSDCVTFWDTAAHAPPPRENRRLLVQKHSFGLGFRLTVRGLPGADCLQLVGTSGLTSRSASST